MNGRKPPAIRGLSVSANRQISDFERAHGLHPGMVARAFLHWGRRLPRRDLAPNCACDSGDHVRTLLENALRALRPQARREFRRQLAPLDERVLARTVNDPFAPRDLPWWKRRMRI